MKRSNGDKLVSVHRLVPSVANIELIAPNSIPAMRWCRISVRRMEVSDKTSSRNGLFSFRHLPIHHSRAAMPLLNEPRVNTTSIQVVEHVQHEREEEPQTEQYCASQLVPISVCRELTCRPEVVWERSTETRWNINKFMMCCGSDHTSQVERWRAATARKTKNCEIWVENRIFISPSETYTFLTRYQISWRDERCWCNRTHLSLERTELISPGAAKPTDFRN